jgi:hypothetical protein
MKITKPRTRVETVERRYDFDEAAKFGCGFSFKVDDDWNVIVTDANRHSVAYVLFGSRTYVPRKTETRRHYYDPARGNCDRCGRTVYLDGFTNTCNNCGADYNLDGQLLAPRHFWGEETGETYADIVIG